MAHWRIWKTKVFQWWTFWNPTNDKKPKLWYLYSNWRRQVFSSKSMNRKKNIEKKSAQTSAQYWYLYRSYLRPVIRFGWTINRFQKWKIIFLSQTNKLSDVNKTYIDISNGQKFELYIYLSLFCTERMYNVHGWFHSFLFFSEWFYGSFGFNNLFFVRGICIRFITVRAFSLNSPSIMHFAYY